MANVRIVRRKKQGLLVEYESDDGRLLRVVVPPAVVSEAGEIEDEVLAMGIPYGLPWAQIVNELAADSVVFDAGAVADALHRVGIWTLDDVRQSPMAAVGALQQVRGVYVNQLIQAAALYDGGRNGNSN